MNETLNKLAEKKKAAVSTLVDAYLMQELFGTKTTTLKEIAVNTGVSYWKIWLLYKLKKARFTYKVCGMI